MSGCFCGFKKQTAITLIALIITIIVLLILAGVVLNTILGDEGIIRKSQVATQKTNYKSAKEIVQMKLLEIQTNCVDEGKSYTIKEIATQMKDDEEILIEKYYTKDTAKVKADIQQGLDGVLGENSLSLKGIVVSVDSYENYKKYKFLIGESGEIKGVIEGEISEGAQEEDFKKLEEFEEQNSGQVVGETEKIEISYEKKSISEDETEVNLLIIVTASQGIEEITKPDGTVINGEGQTEKIIDFTAKVDTDYQFKVKGKGGTIKEITINVNNAIGPLIIEKGETKARSITTADYGKKVKYLNADGSGQMADRAWRLFYVEDSSNLFGDGEGTIYLKADWKSNDYTISTSYTSSETTLIKQLNPSWAEARGESSWQNNEKAAANLCDTSKWEPTYKSKYIAYKDKINWVVGAAPVEMFMKSYSQRVNEATNYKAKYYANGTKAYGYIYIQQTEAMTYILHLVILFIQQKQMECIYTTRD